MTARRPADTSFIHSLAPVWRDLSRSTSRSRRHSANNHDEYESAPPTKDDDGCYARTTTPMAAGILKTHEHEGVKMRSTETSRKVSFRRSQSQGTATRRNNIDNVNSITDDASPPLPRRSLRGSHHWPPPPPPRDSKNGNSVPNSGSTSRESNKDLSSVLKSGHVAKLPFPTKSNVRTHSRPGQRRHSMLETEGFSGNNNNAGIQYNSTTPFLDRRRSDGDGGIFISTHQEFQNNANNNNPLDYVLGDSPRCLSHILIESCPQAALERVSRLNVHDFAFVKRSNGSWSYAILAHRYVDMSNNEEHMMFVLSEVGSTKIVKRSQWAKCVSCVAYDVEKEHVPKTISINKDDCSLISSI